MKEVSEAIMASFEGATYQTAWANSVQIATSALVISGFCYGAVNHVFATLVWVPITNGNT